MTGIKYLNFIADVFGVDENIRQERIRKYAELFELTNDLGQPIAAYSHGMKQKLAIIAAWMHDQKLIIMDEPFVGLDPKASHLLKGMMREVCDNGGAIFSTHVLEVAEKLCDKVAIIKGGKLIRSGTMEEVKGDDSLEEVFLELEENNVWNTFKETDDRNFPRIFLRCKEEQKAFHDVNGDVHPSVSGGHGRNFRGMFTYLSVTLCGPFAMLHMSWLYF